MVVTVSDGLVAQTMARKGRRFRIAPTRSRKELVLTVDGEGIPAQPPRGGAGSGSVIGQGLCILPLPRVVQFAEDGEGVQGCRRGGKGLGLFEAAVGGDEDRPAGRCARSSIGRACMDF